MKLPILTVLCSIAAAPLVAENAPAEHCSFPGGYGLHALPFIEEEADTDPLAAPLTLADFLEWTAISYPNAENVTVLSDRTIQIGSRIYNN